MSEQREGSEVGDVEGYLRSIDYQVMGLRREMAAASRAAAKAVTAATVVAMVMVFGLVIAGLIVVGSW